MMPNANESDSTTHGGPAWDYDAQGRVYSKSVVACEVEDIVRARQKYAQRNGPKEESK